MITENWSSGQWSTFYWCIYLIINRANRITLNWKHHWNNIDCSFTFLTSARKKKSSERQFQMISSRFNWHYKFNLKLKKKPNKQNDREKTVQHMVRIQNTDNEILIRILTMFKTYCDKIVSKLWIIFSSQIWTDKHYS